MTFLKPITVDRSDTVREARERYPEILKRTTGVFHSHKAHYFKETNTLVLEASLDCADLGNEYRHIVAEDERHEFAGCIGINPDVIEDEFGGDYVQKKGMPAKDFCKELRGETKRLQATFLKAREELSKTGLKEQLEESATGFKKKRKRLFSAHDGEWDYDRKWEAEPFLKTEMADTEFPYLEVCFPMNMLYGASARDISEFGARCLALCELLESVGYRIAIVGEDWNEGCIGVSLEELGNHCGFQLRGKPQ